MPKRNVELAARLIEVLNKRDASGLIALSDPDVEWHSFFALGEQGNVFRGHEGARRWIDELNDAWDIVQAEVDDALAVGDIAVLVGHIHYRGRSSGVETESPAGWVLKFRQEQAILYRAFRDPQQALEAAGLS